MADEVITAVPLGAEAGTGITRRRNAVGPVLEGKVVLVTGAASGIGRAIARRLAAEGAGIVCGDLRPAPLRDGLDSDEPTHLAIAAAGGEAAYVQCDISDADDTARAVEVARDRYGRIDIVIANAGIVADGEALPHEDPERWHRVLNVNLTGTWNTVRLGLRALIEQGEGGRIIAISSVAGLIGVPGQPSGYGVSKAGIIQLIRQAAVEGGPHQITANAVCPGYVRTAITRATWADPDTLARFSALQPLGRMGEPSDVAGAVAFLASPDAAWITGIELPVDGGLTCI